MRLAKRIHVHVSRKKYRLCTTVCTIVCLLYYIHWSRGRPRPTHKTRCGDIATFAAVSHRKLLARTSSSFFVAADRPTAGRPRPTLSPPLTYVVQYCVYWHIRWPHLHLGAGRSTGAPCTAVSDTVPSVRPFANSYHVQLYGRLVHAVQ